MNRNALLIYLHDLRDLEVAKYQIKKMEENNYAVNRSKINALDDKERYRDMPKKDYIGILLLGGMGLIITILAYIFLPLMGEIGENILYL